MTQILCDNQARMNAFGPNSPLALPFPFAAKTGTSKDYRDNWAVGYSPAWTIGVWAGNFDGSPMRRVSGISGAAPILHDVAMALYRRGPVGEFPRPRDVVQAEICPVSGLLAGPQCPHRMAEWFRAGHLPSRVCGLHHARQDLPAPFHAEGVEFPRPGEVFRVDPQVPLDSQALHFKAKQTHLALKQPHFTWSMDGVALPDQGEDGWWNLQPGQHQLTMVKMDGDKVVVEKQVRFTVLK